MTYSQHKEWFDSFKQVQKVIKGEDRMSKCICTPWKFNPACKADHNTILTTKVVRGKLG